MYVRSDATNIQGGLLSNALKDRNATNELILETNTILKMTLRFHKKICSGFF